MKQIVIKISPNGTIEAETVNMHGHECQKYIKQIEDITDAVAVDSQYKSEYYENNSTNISSNSVQEYENAIESRVES